MKKTEDVNDYMERLDHPLKAGVQIIRQVIKGIKTDIIEEIKWNAPSYRYKDYIATFNLRDKNRIHLVFHNPRTPLVKSDLLEGNYPDGRRMAYFYDMTDIEAKKVELERVVQEILRLEDEEL
jgi:hypothetical protein